jgi:hypothetical protein
MDYQPRGERTLWSLHSSPVQACEMPAHPPWRGKILTWKRQSVSRQRRMPSGSGTDSKSNGRRKAPTADLVGDWDLEINFGP